MNTPAFQPSIMTFSKFESNPRRETPDAADRQGEGQRHVFRQRAPGLDRPVQAMKVGFRCDWKIWLFGASQYAG
jgi:hypothetical protein